MYSKDKAIGICALALFLCMLVYFIWSNNEKRKCNVNNGDNLKSKNGAERKISINWAGGGDVSINRDKCNN